MADQPQWAGWGNGRWDTFVKNGVVWNHPPKDLPTIRAIDATKVISAMPDDAPYAAAWRKYHLDYRNEIEAGKSSPIGSFRQLHKLTGSDYLLTTSKDGTERFTVGNLAETKADITLIGIDDTGVARHIHEARRDRKLAGALPVCGLKPGIYWDRREVGKVGIYNTCQSSFVEDCDIEPEFILEFIRQFTGREEVYHRVLLTWKLAYVALKAHTFANLPFHFWFGPEGSGKSLMPWIEAQVLGGHQPESCFEFLMKGGENAALAGAPVWKIDDESPPRDKIPHFHTSLKAKQADSGIMFKSLFKDKITIHPLRHIVGSFNHNPSSLALLPTPSDEGGFQRKMIASVVQRPKIIDGVAREWIDDTVRAELPGMRSFLLNYEPPPEIVTTERTIVAPFWDPELVEGAALSSLWASRLLWIFTENEGGGEITPGKYLAFTWQELATRIDNDDSATCRRLFGRLSNLHGIAREMSTLWPHLVRQCGDLWVFRDGRDAFSSFDRPWPEGFEFKETDRALDYE